MSGLTWRDVAIVIPAMPVRRPMVQQLVVEQLMPALERGARLVVREHRRGDAPRVDYPRAVTLGLSLNTPWLLTLEDDVWLAPDFADKALAAINEGARNGANAVSMFSRHGEDLEMLKRGQTWRSQSPKSFIMMQAIAVARPYLEGLPEWAPSWYEERPGTVHAADILLAHWLSKQKAKLHVHVPSLVQHRRSRSTLGGRAAARQSESFRKVYGEVPGE